jgi:predicted ATPase/class 3 adenylate cyclase
MTSEPTGTVTFLFTDIENSTQLAREHPESWDETQARHHAIMREAIESNHGFVFQIIGDAFCAAFHKVGDAVKAAVKAQQDLQGEPWDEVNIYVRMGIHTGEAELVGNNYRGYTTLSFVQRLMSVGHGGQILVSNTAENLLREGLSGQINLRDMGVQKFAGVPSPVRIFQVIVPHLPIEFPPLRTLDNLPNNLPAQLTSFVGRAKQLTDVKRLLNTARMLTLLGPGGTGKTRLSIQAASEMLDQYPDGVWFVELAPILDPLLVPHTTAVAIGLRSEPQRPVIDMLCDYLHEKKILIVLDNCEHLVDACARMADRILHTALDTRILASSREALGIGGEATYRVPSLELPDISNLPTVESLSQYEAVKLFIDRAMSAVPTFTVTNSNAPAVAQVCHRLDGIPLAIELAAAKLRVLSVEQIAKRLDDRFRLLTGGSRTALERHQTLRAAIDWSYKLLSDAEQVLFQRLSVFVGGWRLEAAESVCEGGGIHSEDVLNLLEQLVNKSLVITEEMRQEARYHMLETIRQYAREKLFESGDSEAIRDRHLAYFVKLVEQAEPELYRADQAFWFNKLDEELDNLRLALTWALATDVASGLGLASIPWRFWQRRDYLEAGDWVHQLLERYPKFDSLRAHTLIVYSKYLWRCGNFAEALKIVEQAFQLARALSDRQNEALSLLFLGRYMFVHDHAGIPQLEQSLALYRTLEDKIGQATASSWLGHAYNEREYRERADPLLVESLKLHRELGNLYGIAECLDNLATHAMWVGEFSSSLTWLEEARALYREIGEESGEAEVLISLGDLAYWKGEYQQARSYFEQALKLDEKTGGAWVYWERVLMAYPILRQGDIAQAKEMFQAGIQQFQNDVTVLNYTIQGLASLYVSQKQFERAARLFAWADASRERIGDRRPPVEQKSVDRDLATISANLKQAEFIRFSTEGRAMTVEQAIALALELTE